MTARQPPDRFLVAFSFAGEQRDLVRAIAEAVEARLGMGTVFFDEWFEHYLAGSDADLKLQDIYLKRSVLAVVCISERYGGKPWTQAEHRAVRARQMEGDASQNERDRLAILPIRVGDGEVPGILFNAIVPDMRERTPDRAAELILARLRLVVAGLGAASAVTFNAPLASDSGRRAVHLEDLEQPMRQYDVVGLGPAENQAERWSAMADLEEERGEVEGEIGSGLDAGIAVFGPGRFFGRETELMDIFSVLVDGITQPILLHGPRRMGKTSLMRQIEYLLTHPASLLAYELRPDQIDRLWTICPVLVSLQDLTGTGRTATEQFFAGVLDAAEQVLGHAGADWLADVPDPVRAFRRGLGKLLDAEAAGRGRRLLIIVDEYDEVYRSAFRNLGGNLRAVMFEEQRVRWIVSSTWTMRQERHSSSSPLHNQCHLLKIRELSAETAQEVVVGPARRLGLHWHDHAAVAAVEQTGQRPYLLQILGAGVVNWINTHRLPPVVGLSTVQAVLGQMANGDLPGAGAHFRSIFAGDDPPGDDQDAVRSLGWLILWVLNEANPEPLTWQELARRVEEQAPATIRNRSDWPRWFQCELHDQMDLLHAVHDVLTVDDRRRYRIRVPIFRVWFAATEAHRYPQMCQRLENDIDRVGSSAVVGDSG